MLTESEPTLHKCILFLGSGPLQGSGAADALWDWICTGVIQLSIFQALSSAAFMPEVNESNSITFCDFL